MNTTKYRNPDADLRYRNLTEHPENFPFSFCYNGERIEGFGREHFEQLSHEVSEKDDKITNTFTWKFDDTLNVTLKCVHYPTHGATDYTVWFENPGSENSGVLSDASTVLKFKGKYPILKGILGDHENRYRPYSLDVSSNPVHFESNIGRPTHINFPYFNLEHGDSGTILTIGWGGTWSADFRYDKVLDTTTYTAKSVNTLHTYLKPGEKIRTALFVCAPYTVREENYATNYWRSWFVQFNLPKADGKGTPVTPFTAASLASDTGIPNSDGSISERYYTWKPSLDKMIEEDIKVDFRWVDAGWYVAPNGTSPDGLTPENDWHSTVGTWTLDPTKWPGNTFRESTDYARANNMKTLMWFEPERVCDVPSLVKNYGYKKEWAIDGDPDLYREDSVIKGSANNIGNPECLEWTLGQITKTLSENRVEMYREDNNTNSAVLWRYLDKVEGENRCGITESKVVDAHYRMWDSIIECTTSYGGCGFVDSCASGGGRNDLESLRKGIPLLRSDHDRTTTAIRLSMTTAFNKWIPFCGALNKEKGYELDATGLLDMYVWRASYLPALTVDSQYVQDSEQDFGVIRKGLREWKRVSKYLLEDFYVLTPWRSEVQKSDFTAFSFFDDEKKEGVLLVFRQEDCNESVINITLPYVNGNEKCCLTDEDSGENITINGRKMTEQGLSLNLDSPRSARLLWVKVTE